MYNTRPSCVGGTITAVSAAQKIMPGTQQVLNKYLWHKLLSEKYMTTSKDHDNAVKFNFGAKEKFKIK